MSKSLIFSQPVNPFDVVNFIAESIGIRSPEITSTKKDKVLDITDPGVECFSAEPKWRDFGVYYVGLLRENGSCGSYRVESGRKYVADKDLKSLRKKFDGIAIKFADI